VSQPAETFHGRIPAIIAQSELLEVALHLCGIDWKLSNIAAGVQGDEPPAADSIEADILSALRLAREAMLPRTIRTLRETAARR